MDKSESLSVTRLLFDGRWLVDSFGSSYNDVLRLVAEESILYEGFPTVCWPSDSSAYPEWAKEMSEGEREKGYNLPVCKRKEKIPEYSSSYRFFEDRNKIAQMNTLSRHFQNLGVREMWSLGFEVRDLILSELINADLMLGLSEEFKVINIIYGGPENLIFTKSNTRVFNRFVNIFGFGGARLLDFFCLMIDDINKDISMEDCEKWNQELPKYSDLLKVQNKEEFIHLLDSDLKNKYIRNAAVFTPFLLDKPHYFSNPYTKLNRQYDVSSDILDKYIILKNVQERKIEKIRDVLEKTKREVEIHGNK